MRFNSNLSSQPFQLFQSSKCRVQCKVAIVVKKIDLALSEVRYQLENQKNFPSVCRCLGTAGHNNEKTKHWLTVSLATANERLRVVTLLYGCSAHILPGNHKLLEHRNSFVASETLAGWLSPTRSSKHISYMGVLLQNFYFYVEVYRDDVIRLF